MNQEKSIDLRELLCHVLKKWRIIVAAAIIIGIFAGASKFVSESKSTHSNVIDVSEQEKVELLEADVERLQKRLDSQMEYYEKSVLMKVDPMNEYVGSIMVSFKADAESDSQDDGNIKKTVASYASYLSSSEFFDYLIDNSSFIPKETKYAKELITSTANVDSATVYFTVYIDSEENAQHIVDITKQAVDDKHIEFAEEFGEFEYSIVTESVYSFVSNELKVSQDNYYNQINELKKSIELKQTELGSLGVVSDNQSSMSNKQIAVAAIKNAVIGCVGGLFLAAICFATWGILTRKMWGYASWSGFGIDTICDVFANKEEKPLKRFDKWIEKFSGCDMENATFGKSCAMSAVRIMSALKNINAPTASVVSISNQPLIEEVVSEMNKTVPDTFVMTGNILNDPDAVLKTLNDENVVLIAVDGELTCDDVKKIVTNLNSWGKKLLGVILIK